MEIFDMPIVNVPHSWRV